ncbi:MAG: hypothetical protein HQL72_06315 [Magnetococcales bacterium]|nr:hypothetical protein [Magnetococcales bacterium]
MSLLLTIHFLAALVWVGGMFFAHFVLRPSAEALPLPERIKLWTQVLNRFMRMVWVAVIALPVSGYWLVFAYYGGMEGLGLHIHLMQGIGWLMILLFFMVYFGPFKQMKIREKEALFPEAGMFMLKIRTLVTINLFLGLITTVVAVAGRFWY